MSTEAPTLELKETINLPKTKFAQKANLPQSEPARLKKWAEMDLYQQIRRARAGLWLVMVLCQVLLFLLHAHLDQLMAQVEDEGMSGKVFRAGFRPVHRAYLWTHTVQWFSGVVYIWLMLRAWTADRPPGSSRRGR